MGNDFWGPGDERGYLKAIHAGLDHGINLIDTAPVYGDGNAEKIVGKAIKGKRDQVVLATKTGIHRENDTIVRDLSPARIRKEIEASLKRLEVDFIDLYQIHWPDPGTPMEDSLNQLVKIRKEGKFRFLGVSNFNVAQLKEASSIAPVVSLQPHFSLLERDIEKEIMPWCIENEIGILSYGSLGGGILTGKFKEKPEFGEGDHRDKFYKYFEEPVWGKVQQLLTVLKDLADTHNKAISHVVLSWTVQQAGISTALVGARNEAQAISNALAGDWQLAQQELKRIDVAYREIFG